MKILDRFKSQRPALPPDEMRARFWADARGVVHIGAHYGQEREFYAEKDLPVLWIEAHPDKAAVLRENLKDYPRQTMLQALLTDRDGEEVTFHNSSNEGMSSSVFEFAGHSDIWPLITMTSTTKLKSRRFDALVRDEAIDLAPYDTLILDVQGAELLVLRGMGRLLRAFRMLQVEAADFEGYKGAAVADDILAFCGASGYEPMHWNLQKRRDGGGGYYDIWFERLGPAERVASALGLRQGAKAPG